MRSKEVICILVMLALLVGGIAFGFFSLEEFIFIYAPHIILTGIGLFLLNICCHGIERPEDADTKTLDDIWSVSQVESRRI
jgi:hypothetical protein